MNKLKRILLVEDNEADQFVFILALEGLDNAVIWDVANNGREAMDRLSNCSDLPDLIFLDINMPKMDGIECLSEILKNPLTRYIPVIMLSSDTGKAELARELGARAFIEKPCDYRLLPEHIEQVINLDFMADSPFADQTLQTRASLN